MFLRWAFLGLFSGMILIGVCLGGGRRKIGLVACVEALGGGFKHERDSGRVLALKGRGGAKNGRKRHF